MKTLNKILLTAATIGTLGLGNMTKSTETFTGKLEDASVVSGTGKVIYQFDVGADKYKSVESIPGGLQKDSTYEVTVNDKYLFPDTHSYKKLN